MLSGCAGPERVDAHAQRTLKLLLQRRVWIDARLFGAVADTNAWIIAQHADRDVALQKDVLRRLEQVVDVGGTASSNVAYLVDRVAANEGRPQRFGTQGACVKKGVWSPKPIEDVTHVDDRRRSSGIATHNGTLAEYVRRMSSVCP